MDRRRRPRTAVNRAATAMEAETMDARMAAEAGAAGTATTTSADRPVTRTAAAEEAEAALTTADAPPAASTTVDPLSMTVDGRCRAWGVWGARREEEDRCSRPLRRRPWAATRPRLPASASARVVGETSRKPSCPSPSPEACRKKTSKPMPVRPRPSRPSRLMFFVHPLTLCWPTVTLRLDEIGRSLRTGNVVPPDHMRSPSPPPTYDSHGRRTNTREVRYRKKLEDERMRLVERQMKLDPNFRAPAEYLMAKRQSSGRPTDKVYIPVKEFPEINFFGLLVGPRGNSLKKMERESGARISIRGKGSVKEGKGKPGHREEDETDELHCLISAESEEKVQNCVKLINSVIETVCSRSFPRAL